MSKETVTIRVPMANDKLDPPYEMKELKLLEPFSVVKYMFCEAGVAVDYNQVEQFLVPPSGSTITVCNWNQRNQSTYPDWIARRWCQAAPIVVPKSSEDDWNLAKRPIVAS